jgi:molybdopterin-guanine dinucleotide biosynthesis protein A
VTGPSTRSAIVLAGGRSTRFGSDKLGAIVGGRSLLELTLDAVAVVAADVVVAGPERPGWPDRGDITIRAVDDREPFGGPLQALAGALDVVRSDIAIVVAGDMPAIVPGVLEALVAELTTKRTGDDPRDAVILADAADPGRRQPLPMALRVDAARAAAGAALPAGDRSLVRLLDRLRVASLPADQWLAIDPDGRSLLDVDEPADLSRLGDGGRPGRRRR